MCSCRNDAMVKLLEMAAAVKEISLLFSLQKVNAHLKRSDNELAQLNTTLNKISMEAHSFVPTITTPPRQDTTPPKPPSRTTHPLFVPSTSYINYWAAGVRWFHNIFLCVNANFHFQLLLLNYFGLTFVFQMYYRYSRVNHQQQSVFETMVHVRDYRLTKTKFQYGMIVPRYLFPWGSTHTWAWERD